MGKRPGPKKGSRSFWHRRRARRVVPRMRYWHAGKGMLGFPGYKAGMTTITIIDDREAPTKGQEVIRAATAIETPPVFVCSVVGFKNTVYGLKLVGETVSTELPKEIKKSMRCPKKSHKIEDIAGCDEYRVKVLTEPYRTGTGKKTPDMVEIGLGGDAAAQFEYAKSIVGKEVRVKDVIDEGAIVDAIGVTTGRGWIGLVQRFNTALNFHKATGARRHGGSIGPERQAKVMYTIPRAGQYGYHRRTDTNKRVLSHGENLDLVFHCYGPIKNDYLLVDGSVPGPSKRFILLRKTPKPVKKPEIRQGVHA